MLDAIAEAFLRAEYHFRLYATGSLEHIHSDLAVEKCLDLLGQEKLDDIRLNLAHALLSHFASEGIEAARQLLVGRPLDFNSRDLRDDWWKPPRSWASGSPNTTSGRPRRAEQEEHRRTMESLAGDWKGQMIYALSKLGGKDVADVPRPKPSAPAPPRPAPRRKPEGRQKIGRNAPCPCGSGKKFKNCCMRK